MVRKLTKTLQAFQILEKEGINFVLTRFIRNQKSDPDDLDILVKSEDFDKVIALLVKEGFGSYSHDQALGGRVKGAQRNLVKEGYIKIDLHQDFTWRTTRYLDLDLIWENLEKERIAGMWCTLPKKEIDIFIILINLIFEKTYITKEDFEYIKDSMMHVLNNSLLKSQSKKYGWKNTSILFENWFKKIRSTPQFPVFLPVYLVIFSYIEKSLHDKRIHIVSLLYYVFFRVRFVVNRRLPYE